MHVMLKLFVMKVLLLLQLTAAISDEEPVDVKIIGGFDTDISLVPYQVSVRLAYEEGIQFGRGHYCGGTAVTPRVVLTAAHCAFNPMSGKKRHMNELVVVLGTTDLMIQIATTQIHNIKSFYIHSNYSSSSLNNDIGLMIINGKIQYSRNVRFLPINTSKMNTNEGTPCIISGWGRTYHSGPKHPRLQSVSVPLISRRACMRSYFIYGKSKLCAGYLEGGVDACQGDSGGPLQCRGVLVGIVSYGRGCALPMSPGVYTNVMYYEDWIRNIISTIYNEDNVGSRCTLRVFLVICLTILVMVLTR